MHDMPARFDGGVRGRWLAALVGCFLAIARCVEAPAAAPVAGGLRVRMSLDVSGELLAPAGPDAAPLREPVEMAARFDFTETVPAHADVAASKAAVCRTFHEATATMRVGDVPTTVTLASDARRILVARQGTTPSPYLADAFLSGEEADLLETPFDALLLDELLVKRPVAIGDAWEIPADVAAGLLAIDTVESGSLEARLETAADGRARIALTGILDGAADGVPTHVTVEGHCFVAATPILDEQAILDAQAGEAPGPVDSAPGLPEEGEFADASTDGNDGATDATITDAAPRLELQGPVLGVSAVIRERRQASHVAPGFEVEAKLSVGREPVDAAASLAAGEDARQPVDEPAEPGSSQVTRRRGDGGPGRVWYRDPQGRFDLVHDARWRRVEDGATGMVMRLIDRGALVGQCSITTLPRGTDAPPPSREDVRRDVERSLAGQITASDAAEEWTNADGLRVVRIASSGTAGRLPFRWIHYVVADQDGRRVSVTFMCEDSMLPRFSDVDRPLIEGLRLATTGPEPSPPAATAAVPDGGRLQPR